MSVYLLAIPVFVETAQQPKQLIRQWSRVFHHGHIKGPIIAIITGLIYGTAAWVKHSSGEPWRVFATAGLVTVSIVPYTLTVMRSINSTLFRVEAQMYNGAAPTQTEAERLVKRWGTLNAVRALIPLTGGVLGLLGTTKVLVF